MKMTPLHHPLMTPLLDIDMEAGDTYLAELARRSTISHFDQSEQDAVLHWIN